MEEFQRQITSRVFMKDEAVILSAIMQDRYHDISVEVVVDMESMEITSAAADFKRAPTEHCQKVARSMEGLIGLVVGKGMNRRLLELLGGRDGCGNLRNILGGLLPLALNVKAASGMGDEAAMLDSIGKKLEGTCAGYPLDRTATSF